MCTHLLIACVHISYRMQFPDFCEPARMYLNYNVKFLNCMLSEARIGSAQPMLYIEK